MHRLIHKSAPWLLVVIGLGIYANSLSNPFVFDDESAIVKNTDIRQITPLWRDPQTSARPSLNGRPLVRLSLALNYAVHGLDVLGYRLVNIAIHICNALILLAIVRRSLQNEILSPRWQRSSPAIALVIALLWMVHPLQTQCVNYITQRSESLMALCYLLSLYCAIRALHGNHRAWYAATALFCALGMASKEVMVTAPVIVLLYDRIFHAPSFDERFLEKTLILGSLSAHIVRPGDGLQNFHSDIPGHMLNPLSPVMMNTVWTLVDFTPQIGGTRIVPGSHKSGHDGPPEGFEVQHVFQPTCKAGSVLVFNGQCWHAGGANDTNDNRYALFAHYRKSMLMFQLDPHDDFPPAWFEQLNPRQRELLRMQQGPGASYAADFHLQ